VIYGFCVVGHECREWRKTLYNLAGVEYYPMKLGGFHTIYVGDTSVILAVLKWSSMLVVAMVGVVLGSLRPKLAFCSSPILAQYCH